MFIPQDNLIKVSKIQGTHTKKSVKIADSSSPKSFLVIVFLIFQFCMSVCAAYKDICTHIYFFFKNKITLYIWYNCHFLHVIYDPATSFLLHDFPSVVALQEFI